MLQSSSATAATEEHVLKILRVLQITRARASQAIPANTVKLVSSRVYFHGKPSENYGVSPKYGFFA